VDGRFAVRHSKDAGRVELDPQNAGHSAQGLAILPRADLKDGIVIGEPHLFPDVQAGMGVEDLQAGEHQEEQADGPDPVSDPGQETLAIDEGALGHCDPPQVWRNNGAGAGKFHSADADCR
jgi:hypothetical protein